MVRNRKFQNLKFRRQYPIEFKYDNRFHFFVADFFCFEKKLIIEIDGEIHDYQKKSDEMRTNILNLLGYKIIRITNKEILENVEKVFKNLTSILSA